MTEEDNEDSERKNLESIPEEVQDMSLEEIVDCGYEVIPFDESGNDNGIVEERRPPPAAVPWLSRGEDHDDRFEDGYTTGYDSHMATRIGDEEQDDEEVERMRELHEGRHRSDGDHSRREAERDKMRIPQAICSQLPLTSYERETVVEIVSKLDLTRFGQHKGIESVTLGVIAVVVDQQRAERVSGELERGERSLDDTLVSRTGAFRKMCDSHEIEMSDLSTIKGLVREALREGVTLVGPNQPRRNTAIPPQRPEEYPREYWDRLTPQRWVHLANRQDGKFEDMKDAVPQEYCELVEYLQEHLTSDSESDLVEYAVQRCEEIRETVEE